MNLDDSKDLYDFAANLIGELKNYDGWAAYPESVLMAAQDIFVNEQLESDYYVDPSERMLAIMFHENLKWARDDAMTNVIHNPPAFLIIGESLSDYILLGAPENPEGISHILCRAEPMEYIVGLTPQQAKEFYDRQREGRNK